MILADKILVLRKRCGWSQDELAEKMNVSRQSVSKWESAQSIPDINKILELARLFGVTTDSLLKDEVEGPVFEQSDEPAVRQISLEEAGAVLERTARDAKRVALGVLLCILSPVALILLAGYSEAGRIAESVGVGIGLVLLFALIATAVSIFILSSIRSRGEEKLKKQPFELAYGVAGAVGERAESFLPVYTACLIAGVSLCILSVIPLIVAGLIGCEELVYIRLTCLLFLLVGAGVYLIIRACMKKEGFDLLLKDGEYDPHEREKAERDNRFGGFYWPIVTAVYLAGSFLTNRWDLSWVVWPVAALVYVGISAAIRRD